MQRGILATREELGRLRERISRQPFDTFYQALQKRCALIFKSAPMTEMDWQAAWESGRPHAATAAAQAVQGRILDLLISHAIDENVAYRDRAIEEFRNVLRWSTWVDPSNARTSGDVDLCTAELGVAVAVGLDWLWEDLDDAVRQEAIAMLSARVIEPYRLAVDKGVWWYDSVNHWNATVNAACGLVALAMSDEDERASGAHDLARVGLGRFFDDLGKEGGWDEGLGLGGYALRYVLLLAEACARLRDDQKVFHHRGMDVTGLFPIYFTPNGKPVGFGDYNRPPLHGALYLLDTYFDRPEITWWLDTYSFQHDVNSMGWSHAGLALLFRRDRDEEIAPPALEPIKAFHQAGWTAMADHWPTPEFYAAIKTGELASGVRRDMNAVQLQVAGELLVCEGHCSAEEVTNAETVAFYDIETHAHSTLLVGDEEHCPDAKGTVLHTHASDTLRWTVCCGGVAGGFSSRWYRHVLMLLDSQGRGETLVVLDELDLQTPQLVEAIWHAAGPIELHAPSATGRIVGQRANVQFGLGASVPLMVTAESYDLPYGRSDRVLRCSATWEGQQCLASVFSRHDPLGATTVVLRDDGGISVRFANTTLAFNVGEKHLVLTGVSHG